MALRFYFWLAYEHRHFFTSLFGLGLVTRLRKAFERGSAPQRGSIGKQRPECRFAIPSALPDREGRGARATLSPKALTIC